MIEIYIAFGLVALFFMFFNTAIYGWDITLSIVTFKTCDEWWEYLGCVIVILYYLAGIISVPVGIYYFMQ